MNVRDLKYLVALAEHRHFGKAADACFVSQPALSMQIKKLEEILGVTLLERTNKSLLFTEVGSEIVTRAQTVLNQVEEIFEVSKLAKDPLSGELRLGIFPTLAPYLLPLIIPPLAKKFPKLSFYLIEEETSVLLEQLKSGKIHAALLALPILDKNLMTSLLFSEEFILATPKHHDLAKRKMVKNQDLDEQNLLLLAEGHCMREQALSFCQTMAIKQPQDFRATSLETLRHMVIAGLGITLLPKLACSRKDANIAYIPFTSPKPQRTIGLVWRDTTAKTILLRGLAEQIKKVMEKHPAVAVGK